MVKHIPTTIGTCLRKHGIMCVNIDRSSMPRKKQRRKWRKCLTCHLDYPVYRSNQKYCSPLCRVKAWHSKNIIMYGVRYKLRPEEEGEVVGYKPVIEGDLP